MLGSIRLKNSVKINFSINLFFLFCANKSEANRSEPNKSEQNKSKPNMKKKLINRIF